MIDSALSGSTFWFGVGAAGMLLGALLFAVKVKTGHDRNKNYFVILSFIATVAGISYLTLATGIGIINIGDSTFHLSRWVDWLITTPLILLLFALIANCNIKQWGIMATIDVLMIATGGLAAVTPAPQRFLWFGLSSAMLVALLYYLHRVITASAALETDAVKNLYMILRDFLTVIYAVYPIVWIASPLGLDALTVLGTDIAFMVLDIITKVGIGVVVIRSTAALDDLSQRESEMTDAVSGDTPTPT